MPEDGTGISGGRGVRLTSGLKATGNIVQETPQDFFDFLNGIFRFDLDVCALPENAKCERFYTPEDDGLSQLWGGEYGATHHTARTLSTGPEKHQRNTGKTTANLLLCSFRPAQTPSGFSSTFCRMRGCGLLMVA